jgi:ribonuclease D
MAQLVICCWHACADSCVDTCHSLSAGLQVLRTHVKKSKTVTMSNWAAKDLKSSQIKYAAFDALITGQVRQGAMCVCSA